MIPASSLAVIPELPPPQLPDWWHFRGNRPRTVAEVLAENANRPAYLLDGLVHPRATLLTGPPKAGKSMLVVEWVTALATGYPWHGRQVHGGPRRVLILPTDPGGADEYARRLGDQVGGNVGLTLPPRPGHQDGW